ncbi:hypothetical protein [Haloglomus halophilum]|uniref:hypothetical protein n=1 Tax=Haloglomus halophilum TaxID=2962672 RepID=UPI0020C98ED3|nr:hypothetical protein [Haloglomus halophilum]
MAMEDSPLRTGVGSSLIFAGFLCFWAGTGLHGFGRQWDGIYIDLFVELLGLPNTLFARATVLLSGVLITLVGVGIVPGEAESDRTKHDIESDEGP